MPFDPQPTLAGELVGARPLRVDDADALFAVAADPAVWEQHPAHDRHEDAVFREFFAESMASGGALLVTDAERGTVILAVLRLLRTAQRGRDRLDVPRPIALGRRPRR